MRLPPRCTNTKGPSPVTHLIISFQVLCKERLQLIKRNRVLAAAVIKIGVDCVGNDHQFLISGVLAVLDHGRIGVAAEIAGVCFVAVDQKDRAADLVGVLQNRLIHERLTSDHIPPAVGVQRAGMIASVSLIIMSLGKSCLRATVSALLSQKKARFFGIGRKTW